MMEQKFIEYSDIQCYVEKVVEISGKKLTDTLFVTISSDDEPRITLSIKDCNNADNTDFIILTENLEKILTWLKKKNIINI